MHHHKHPKDRLKNITFDGILSKGSYYGVVWNGLYKGKKNCVIKMVRIANGLTDEKYFQNNDHKPFKHKLFLDKTAMRHDVFINEVNKQKTLYGFGLAPKIYSYWVDKESSYFHYGFIVMKKMNCTVKDILLKRDLSENENIIINSLINRLHQTHEIVHRDLKPANIGVFLDSNGWILKCLFLDCCNVRFKSDVSPLEFSRLVKQDWNKYELHTHKNIKQRTLEKIDFTIS